MSHQLGPDLLIAQPCNNHTNPKGNDPTETTLLVAGRGSSSPSLTGAWPGWGGSTTFSTQCQTSRQP
jgi:hypothetical protein